VLDHVDVYINDSNATGENLLWDIRPVSAGTPLSSDASVLASGTVVAASIPVFPQLPPTLLDLSAYDIQVQPGVLLAVTLRTSGTVGFAWRGAYLTNPGVKFSRPGNNQTWLPETFDPGHPLGFDTYVRTVPEPSTCVLLLSATCLGFLISLVRGQRKLDRGLLGRFVFGNYFGSTQIDAKFRTKSQVSSQMTLSSHPTPRMRAENGWGLHGPACSRCVANYN
jgi:hypothetical protein